MSKSMHSASIVSVVDAIIVVIWRQRISRLLRIMRLSWLRRNGSSINVANEVLAIGRNRRSNDPI